MCAVLVFAVLWNIRKAELTKYFYIFKETCLCVTRASCVILKQPCKQLNWCPWPTCLWPLIRSLSTWQYWNPGPVVFSQPLEGFTVFKFMKTLTYRHKSILLLVQCQGKDLENRTEKHSLTPNIATVHVARDKAGLLNSLDPFLRLLALNSNQIKVLKYNTIYYRMSLFRVQHT